MAARAHREWRQNACRIDRALNPGTTSLAVVFAGRTPPPVWCVANILLATVREKAAALTTSSVVLAQALCFAQSAIDLLKNPLRVPIGGCRLGHVKTLVQIVVPTS